MSDLDDARRSWVKRVLGVELDRPPAPGRDGAWSAARAGWQRASEVVDGQMNGLQAALRATGDGELGEIAEYGLNAMTGGYKTRMMAAMTDLGGTGPDAAAKALKLVRGLRSQIEADERVAACDANPFGVAVSIRATLGPALDALAAALVPVGTTGRV